MKILVLVGSYRKHGNTSQVAGLIAESLQAEAKRQNEDLEIETLYLNHQNIGLCRGCRVCFDRGEEYCPLKDDLLSIKARMQAADGILVASPIYVDDISAAVKNWIDRLAHVCHRPEFAGKTAYLVVTVGSSPFNHALRTMKLALSTWGFSIAGQAGFKAGALMRPDEMRAAYQKKAERAAQEFFRALHERQFARPSFISLMMFKIQQLSWQRERADSVDLRYWRRQGWVDPRRDFYIQHQAGRLKVALARLTGAVIFKFVA